MGAPVSLIRVESPQEEIAEPISQALQLIDFSHEGPVELVSIKPNLCYYWDAATGYTTDPRVVAWIIDYTRQRYGEDATMRIVESDATAMKTKYTFPALRYDTLAKEKDVELFNLSNDRVEKKTVNVNGLELAFRVPQSLLESDLFINVPKLKTMRATGITCAMKNIFGCIASPRKIIYHEFLAEAIVGINKILRPHLTIVDGLIGLGRHPAKLGLLMASVDPFSIDWVASQIMGYTPSDIGFLRIAAKEKLGTPEGMKTEGEDIRAFKELFPRESLLHSKLWDIQLWLLNAYNKIVKDVIPPELERT